MGRPLNSKYFSRGTRGKDVVSVTMDPSDPGSFNSVTFPSITFNAPQLPGGVLPTAVVTDVTAVQGNITANGSGYHIDDVLTVQGGTKTVPASFRVNAVVTTNAVLTAAGTIYDVSPSAKDEIWFDTAGWSTPLKIRVDTVTGGNGVATFTIIQQGVWSGPGAAPTSVVGTSTHNGPIDNNGNGATFNLTYGVYSATQVVTGGDYTAVTAPLVSTGAPTTVAPAGGTGAQIKFDYGISAISVTNPGSGYGWPAQATVSSGTIIVTPGEAGAYNVILPYAWTPGTGGATSADIVKQVNTDSYVMTSRNGTGIVSLTDGDLVEGTAHLTAFDSLGSKYLVTKLTAHKVRLTQYEDGGSGFEYESGDDIPWGFDAAVQGVVMINNA